MMLSVTVSTEKHAFFKPFQNPLPGKVPFHQTSDTVFLTVLTVRMVSIDGSGVFVVAANAATVLDLVLLQFLPEVLTAFSLLSNDSILAPKIRRMLSSTLSLRVFVGHRTLPHRGSTISCPKWDSNPQAARFELARYASSRHLGLFMIKVTCA